MERGYLTNKEIEALELLKKHGSQKDVARHMESSGANVSLTLKRARDKIARAKNTIQEAEEKDYLRILGISHLTDTGRLLDALMNSSEKAICILDKKHQILMVNEAVERLFGDSTHEFIGRDCHEVFVGKKLPKSDCPLAISFKTGKVTSATRRCTSKDGKALHLKITAIPVRNKRGQIAFGIEYFEPLEE